MHDTETTRDPERAFQTLSADLSRVPSEPLAAPKRTRAKRAPRDEEPDEKAERLIGEVLIKKLEPAYEQLNSRIISYARDLSPGRQRKLAGYLRQSHEHTTRLLAAQSEEPSTRFSWGPDDDGIDY